MGKNILNCGVVVSFRIVGKSIELRVVNELLGFGTT
jgi:hypothetical protein